MKTLLALFFAIGTAYAQPPLLGSGGGGSGSGGSTPYVVPSFTGSPQTITAATHGQGKDAIAVCWLSTTPSTWTNCGLTNADPSSATAGNIVLTYAVTPSRVIIYTPGQGAPGAKGDTGASGAGLTVAADASGSTTTYTSAGSPVVTALTNGLAVDFIPQTTNTGASTLNLGSPATGAKSIVYSDGTAIGSGALVGGLHYLLVYDTATTTFRVPVKRYVAGATGCLTSSEAVSPGTFDINTACVPQLTAANAFSGANTFSGGIISAGTAPTVDNSSCSGSTIGSGATMLAGTLTGSPTATCTVGLTFPFAATTGWVCAISNRTTGNLIRQTASTTTKATFVGVTVSGDVLQYGPCMAY